MLYVAIDAIVDTIRSIPLTDPLSKMCYSAVSIGGRVSFIDSSSCNHSCYALTRRLSFLSQHTHVFCISYTSKRLAGLGDKASPAKVVSQLSRVYRTRRSLLQEAHPPSLHCTALHHTTHLVGRKAAVKSVTHEMRTPPSVRSNAVPTRFCNGHPCARRPCVARTTMRITMRMTTHAVSTFPNGCGASPTYPLSEAGFHLFGAHLLRFDGGGRGEDVRAASALLMTVVVVLIVLMVLIVVRFLDIAHPSTIIDSCVGSLLFFFKVFRTCFAEDDMCSMP